MKWHSQGGKKNGIEYDSRGGPKQKITQLQKKNPGWKNPQKLSKKSRGPHVAREERIDISSQKGEKAFLLWQGARFKKVSTQQL